MPTLIADRIEKIEPADPIDRIEAVEPIDRIEPADPIDKMDPADPIDRIEPADPMDRIDPAEPIDEGALPTGPIPAFSQVCPARTSTGRATGSGNAPEQHVDEDRSHGDRRGARLLRQSFAERTWNLPKGV